MFFVNSLTVIITILQEILMVIPRIFIVSDAEKIPG